MGRQGHTDDLGARSLRLHEEYRGKIAVTRTVPEPGLDDWSVWYTPGVAEVSRAIHEDPERSFDLTWRWNTVAVVSDGTRVLGLGNIGPEAALPVMEGKALLFRELGGVDGVPIVLDATDPDRFVDVVRALAPSFGGINLEDIESPKCYKILDALKNSLDIPVWHDDRQGTATVVAAGLRNALRVVGKKPEDVRVVFLGAGAAGLESARFVHLMGVPYGNMVLVDVKGVLHPGRIDLDPLAKEMAGLTNPGVRGGLEEAIKGADVLVALSAPGPGTVLPEHVAAMARDAVVFACANPVPEIWPDVARKAGAAVVATGRSDFPNQVNNSLAFPGIFRGVLEVRARTITDSMCVAAIEALSSAAGEPTVDRILPTMEDRHVPAVIAERVALKAMEEGVARVRMAPEKLRASIKAHLAR